MHPIGCKRFSALMKGWLIIMIDEEQLQSMVKKVGKIKATNLIIMLLAKQIIKKELAENLIVKIWS